MIVDTSAVIAVMLDEPERRIFQRSMENADVLRIATPTLLEATMVLVGRHGPRMSELLDRFLQELAITAVPFTDAHAATAREAFLRYGKGRHAAGLNFGDCMAYAVAKVERLPLLFKGDDFRLTDVEPAIAR